MSSGVPARASSSAWVVSPSGVEPGRGGGVADRGEVDGRGEVLAPDVAERVAADGVAGERPERAGRARPGPWRSAGSAA